MYKRNSVKVNFSYNLMYQILAIIVPLITSPYLARTLKAEAIGINSWSYSVVSYFVMFAALGLNNYGNREIAKTRAKGGNIGRTFSSIYAVQFVTSVFAVVAYFVYMILFASRYKEILWIQLLYIISQMLDVTWYFAGLEDFRSVVIRNSLVKVLNIGAIFIFVHTPDDLWIYTFITAFLTMISQAAMWPIIFKDIKFNIPSIDEVKPHIKPVIILFIPVMAISVFTYMDKLMIGVMSTMEQNGFYENTNKVIGIPKAVITALGTVMMPRTASLIAEGREDKSIIYIENTMTFTFAFGAPLVFGMMAVATIFAIVFWGNDFASCGPLIAVMAPSVLFSVYGNVIRTQYLIPRSKDIEYTISLIIGAVVNFIVNFALIPAYGAMGATIGTLIAEIVMTTIQAILVCKKLPVIKYITQNGVFLLFAFIMYIILKDIQFYIKYSAFNLVMLVILGSIIYMVMFFIYIYFSKTKQADYLRNQIQCFIKR